MSDRSQRTRHRGMSLVELLIVVAIVGVLASLSLAAVVSARQSSQRTTCLNNLRQISIALLGYHDANRRYPGLGYSANGGGFDFIAPYPALLPFLGHKDVYDLIDFEKAQFDGNFFYNEIGFNVTAKRTILAQLLCPSDVRPFAFAANVNYAFSTGATANGRHDGAFALFRSYASRDIVDGLTKTAAIGEILLGGGRPERFDKERDFWYSENDATSYLGTTADQMLELCRSDRSGREFYVFRGFSWFNGGYENTWYNHVAGPNSPVVDCSMHTRAPFPPSNAGSFASRSMHSGGVQTAYLDGSVRWSGSNIDLTVWRALGTRAGGESVQPP